MTTHIRCYVKLNEGTLAGLEEKLPNGKPLYVFRGVPYALPPVGQLRFKAPEPIIKYDEAVLDCSTEGNICIQQDMISRSVIGSEDCLYLNIYTPDLANNHNRYPVMLYLHGGGFGYGSGNAELYSPEYLVQQNTIVVTCNYRLGPFGFLYLPKAGITGNYGLLDQLMALQWINKNIEFFSGDKDNVTLFGESAGGASVHYHLMSQQSKKYFHKAILQSGVANCDWAIQSNPQYKTRKLAESLGCESKDDQDILQFLINVDGNKLTRYYKKILTQLEIERGFTFPFRPYPDRTGGFLTRFPNDLMQNRNTYTIPVMIGYNSGEGQIIIPLEKKIKQFNDDLQLAIPPSINLTKDSTSSLRLSDEIREFYFNGEEIDNKNNIQKLIDLLGDANFIVPINATIKLHKNYQKLSPLYFYKFDFNGDYAIYKKLLKFDHVNSVCHADELFYLFKSKLFHSDNDADNKSESYKMREIMCKMWTNFAKYGNPTPKYISGLTFVWEPIDNNSNDNNCLYIGDEIKMIKNPDDDRINFWKSVYKIWNGGYLYPKL